MSKRQHDSAREDSGTSKRQRRAAGLSPELFGLLKKCSKELRSFVKATKDDDFDGDASAERLAELRKTLIPPLEALVEKDCGPDQNDAAEGRTGAGTPAATGADATKDAVVATSKPSHDRSLFASILPPVGSMTAWTVEDIPREHPPLPPIPDPSLERLALTHRGTNNSANYEVLEFLGDAFIYYLASEVISQTFPRLSPGRQSQKREGLLRNSNLALYTVHYGLDKRVSIPSDFVGDGRAGEKERQKVNGDLFESYVGALIRARPPPGQDDSYDGVVVATRWLRSLWAMTLARDIRTEYHTRARLEEAQQEALKRSVQADDNGTAGGPEGPSRTADNGAADPKPIQLLPAKVRLATTVLCKPVAIRYEDGPPMNRRDEYTKLPLFTMGVWIDGWGKSECLGYGTALSKKEASEKAAEQALGNKKQMKFYVAKKKAFLEMQAKRAQEASV